MRYKNNPLNIRYNQRNIWRGQYFPKDGFCQFNSLYFGFRAAWQLIKRYRHYGVFTIRGIIYRWAPPSENKTDKYIDTVCELMSEQLRKPIGHFDIILTKKDVIALLFCMARVETGEIDLEWKDIIKQVLDDENFVQFK